MTINPFIEEIEQVCHFIKSKDKKAIQRLLQNDQNIINQEIQDEEGKSVLQYALQYSSFDIIRLLVEKHDANPAFQDWNGNTAFHDAVNLGRINSLVIFIKYHSRFIDIANHKNITPIQIAIEKKDIYTTLLLLQGGSKVRQGDEDSLKQLLVGQEQQIGRFLLYNKLYNNITDFNISNDFKQEFKIELSLKNLAMIKVKELIGERDAKLLEVPKELITDINSMIFCCEYIPNSTAAIDSNLNPEQQKISMSGDLPAWLSSCSIL